MKQKGDGQMTDGLAATVAFDHPFLSSLLGDTEVAEHLGAPADLRAMLAFEAALARVQAPLGLVPHEAAERIGALCAGFQPDIAALNAATARDGVVVPELVRQLRRAAGDDAPHVHLGATSQDVIDTSLMVRLRAILPLFAQRLRRLDLAFDQLIAEFGGQGMMGRTRMQAAIPIKVTDRVAAWRAPLAQYIAEIDHAIATVPALQFGGAAGTLERFGEQGPALRSALAKALGLADVPQWHSQRSRLTGMANSLCLITGSLGKFGQDIALLAQDGRELSLAGGGGSSAMPHKQNPVAAEILVALARFNAVQISGMHHAMVHEQERSGAAWTLEWLLLPQILLATGAALRHAIDLAGNIRSLGQA